MGLTVWKKGRLNIQQEVGEKEESTIVTLQLCTINRISTHTHTHTQIFPACLCLAPSYSQESHLRNTVWDIPALLSSLWQGAQTHTHREILMGSRSGQRVAVKCTQTYTMGSHISQWED